MLLFLVASANAQVVEMKLILKDESILIGKQTLLKLEIIKHQKVEINNFPLLDSLSREIEVVDSVITSAGDTIRKVFTITSFKPGNYRISRIPLAFRFEENLDTVYSPELYLRVNSPEIDSKAEIKDIKPPLTLPFRLREIIPQAGLAMAIMAIFAAALFYIIRKLRKKNILEETNKLLPPHVLALRELDRIKEERLWQNGKVKEYYSRLSDTIRTYIEKRFDIPAMEYVSSETLNSFRKTMPHEELLVEMLDGILSTADIVKFAKGEPLPVTNQGNMDNAYLFVEQTKIEEQAPLANDASETEKLSENIKIEKE